MALSSSPPAEVPEDAAQGRIKATYDDIKTTLRVPLVNLIYRVLATHPEYLQLAWRQIKPNARTVYCERRADEIRQRAVEGMTALGTAPQSPDGVSDVLKVFHYINPKLLLIVAAVRAATNGQYPLLEELPREEKRQIEAGIPSGAPAAIDLVHPATAAPEVAAIFEDIQATLGLTVVNSDYRALAQWPDYLAGAWNSLKPLTEKAEYRALLRDLRLLTEDAILNMPFRVEINPHIMRLCGLSEADIDEVRETLESFSRLLPGLIANIAYLAAGALGRDAALASPYPPAIV